MPQPVVGKGSGNDSNQSGGSKSHLSGSNTNNRSEPCVVVREGGTKRRQRGVLAVLSSPENTQHPSIVPGVHPPGATLAHRQSVRSVRFGGVQEQGEVPQGLTRNTGYPSFKGRCQVRAHQRGPIPAARFRAERNGEGSGSLSTCIVAMEGWRTCDGEEPVSSKGRCLSFGINVLKHTLTPQRL